MLNSHVISLLRLKARSWIVLPAPSLGVVPVRNVVETHFISCVWYRCMPRWNRGHRDDEPVITFEIPPELDERDVRTKLGQHSGSEFEQLVKAHGTDAIGWYFPFHYQIAQHGIYISSKNLLPFALRTFSSKYSDNFCEDLAKKLQYAMHAVLRHESFHFAAECMAANWELSTGSACYIRARETLRGPNGYLEDEEALANAYMLRGFRWSSSATRGSRATPRLKAFCSRQPPGYNRGSHYVRADRYETGCRDLAFQHEKCSTAAWRAPQDSFDSLVLYPNALADRLAALSNHFS